MELLVGSKFPSFDDVNKIINQYEEKNFVKLYKKDSRTIPSFKKRCPKRFIREELTYSYLVYSCIHGGKKFKSRSTGKQLNTRLVQYLK